MMVNTIKVFEYYVNITVSFIKYQGGFGVSDSTGTTVPHMIIPEQKLICLVVGRRLTN